MDPYLEGSDWRSVHTHLSVEIARYLVPRLAPKYFVRTEKNHMDVVIPEDDIQVVVEIYDVDQRSLVTAIEVLSSTNKIKSARVEYLAKRRKYLCSPAHLMEIDLLRKGERPPMVDPLPEADYFVILSRAGRRPHAEVWPISIRSPLPTVPVPLMSGDPDVSLDLQLVLTEMYDTFRFDLDLNYSKPPEIPLKPQDAAWAAQLIANTKDKKNGK
jgi:hypothetical protein